MASLILTIIGPDRPGLVRSVSEAVAAHGGSWLESRMARLAGQFAGIVLVEAPEALLADLPGLEREGLRITATATAGAEPVPATGTRLRLDVTGNDRPGIVREISEVIAGLGMNIEELTTEVVSGSFSGESLFRAGVALRAPDESAVDALRTGLERLGEEMMIDIHHP